MIIVKLGLATAHSVVMGNASPQGVDDPYPGGKHHQKLKKSKAALVFADRVGWLVTRCNLQFLNGNFLIIRERVITL